MKIILFFVLLLFSSLSFSNEIRLVISSGAGGITHKYALEIVPIISRATGKTVVAEIKAGAEGYIAADFVNSKNNSNETVLLIGTPKKWNSIENKSNISHISSFNTVSYLGNTPTVIAVNNSKRFNSINDLLNHSKTNKVSYGIAMNNPFRPAMVELIEKYGNKNNVVEVTYKSGAGAINDALGYHVDAVISTYETLDSFISDGKLVPLAIVTPRKSNPSKIKTLEEQNVIVQNEFKYYANIFLWSNLSANKDDIEKIRSAILRFLTSDESLKLRKDMYISYDLITLQNPREYLTKILE